MGEDPRKRKWELESLRLGLDLGITLIDTAEMYGDGGAEKLIAEAFSGRRDEVFLVSKFYPQNATRNGMTAACERSLRRLRTDRIDLYLLHWRGSVPLQETLAGFDQLLRAGKIRHWGVSNFDLGEMSELSETSGGSTCATNQVLYNLTRRGIEFDLLPWSRAHHMPIMAYSPIEQGRVLTHATLRKVATRHEATPAQVALAWLTRQEGVIVIPKAGTYAHVEEDLAALDLNLTKDDLATLDRAFPPPKKAQSLDML